MKVDKLPVFVKFVFMSENSDHRYATTDINVLKGVRYRNFDESIYQLKVSQEIYFEWAEKDNTFKIIDIYINQIFDDISMQKLGMDSEDYTEPIGAEKDFLFKVFVRMNLVHN